MYRVKPTTTWLKFPKFPSILSNIFSCNFKCIPSFSINNPMTILSTKLKETMWLSCICHLKCCIQVFLSHNFFNMIYTNSCWNIFIKQLNNWLRCTRCNLHFCNKMTITEIWYTRHIYWIPIIPKIKFLTFKRWKITYYFISFCNTNQKTCSWKLCWSMFISSICSNHFTNTWSNIFKISSSFNFD